MPVYDDVGHLPAAVERALGQVGVDVELVLVDDGSTDGSREVARSAAEDDDRVVAVLLPANGGVAAARRAGVEAASGEWVWFVDSDDHWPADGAQRLLAAAEQGGGGSGVDAVVASAVLVEPGGARRRLPAPVLSGGGVTGPEAVRLLLRGEVTGHLWTKLLRRSLLLGVDFPRPRVQSDMALVALALAEAREVRATAEQVYEYRKRAGSIITSAHQRADSLEVVDGVVTAAARRSGVPDHDPDLRWFRLRYVALSGLKDALSGAYAPGRSRELVARARRGIGLRGLAALARRRDKRLLLAALAYAPRRLQELVLTRR